jgi:hypothetical protein
MDEDDRDRLLETLDEWTRGEDFSLVQDGGDLSFHSPGARGYHYTSRAGLAKIAREGLGLHPGLFEDHELTAWVTMSFVPTDVALEAIWQTERRNRERAIKLLTESLAEETDLKVAWFYREEGFGGSTAGYSQECVSFSLEEVGYWLAENTQSPQQFTDYADGYAVAWIGPPIPPHFLTGCDGTVFPPVQKNRRASRRTSKRTSRRRR